MPTLEQRLIARTTIDPRTGCHTWQGAKDRHGYGKVKHNGRTEQVHRIAYTVLGPEFDHSLTLDHLCRNTLCWNTAHLEPVTQRTNNLRGRGMAAINTAKTHCPKGHEYTEANTYRRARGDRECRACRSGDSHSV